MEKYKVEIKKSAVKEIKALPSQVIRKILAQIASLSDNPRPSQSLKMSGEEKYRMRCGDYRILYTIEDNVLTVYVVKVGHRREVYR
ncbi:MAG TPA: type II toxin-antitoxin system mRNA interferase toxin, RelE/StbE family [Candidatus Omnitrophica bacterium]|nr:MAG: addiction module antitoxin [Omnitrophica WOR_2 bacterium GWA2_45_18]HBR14973.1 type II toxin-antitoxin system mRNA interferase toxin, RelE/StbE family [Candidatus Omnitrophota bacterium]